MATTTSTPLGDLLRHVRKGRRLTLEQAAAIAGISRSYLHRLETGSAARPSLEVIEALSRALDVDYAALARVAGHNLPMPPSVDAWRQAVIERLLAEDPTEDELEELIRYLRFVRARPAPVGALTDDQLAVADVLAEGVTAMGDIAMLTGLASADVERAVAELRELAGASSITRIVPVLRKRRLWPTAQPRRAHVSQADLQPPVPRSSPAQARELVRG